MAGDAGGGVDRRAAADPHREKSVVGPFLQVEVAPRRVRFSRLRGTVGHVRLGLFLGYGLQGNIPGVGKVAAPGWIWSAIRCAGGRVLAG